MKSNYHDKKLAEMSKEIVEKGAKALAKTLDKATIDNIIRSHKVNPNTWWALYHHGWGTNIRNYLRKNVCLDDKLPDKNWDDYYIPLVEIVCGIRKIPEWKE